MTDQDQFKTGELGTMHTQLLCLSGHVIRT